MDVKLLSGALGAEIQGIDLTDLSDKNFNKINDLLLEHKVIFFRDQPITKDQQIALAGKFGPLETHAYVKGLKDYPEIVRIIKGKEEKNQWGENWHSDVSYNSKPTKAVVLKSIKIPPVGGDTCFSNMELAWETLDEKIKEKIKDKRAIHSSLGAEFFLENYKNVFQHYPPPARWLLRRPHIPPCQISGRWQAIVYRDAVVCDPNLFEKTVGNSLRPCLRSQMAG